MNVYLVFSTVYFWWLKEDNDKSDYYTCYVRVKDVVTGRKEMPVMNIGAWLDTCNDTCVVRV